MANQIFPDPQSGAFLIADQLGGQVSSNPLVAHSVDEMLAFAEEAGLDARKLKTLRGYPVGMQQLDDDAESSE